MRKWQIFFKHEEEYFHFDLRLELKTRPFSSCEKCGISLPGMFIEISITNIKKGEIRTVSYPEDSLINIGFMSENNPIFKKALRLTQKMFYHEQKYCFEHIGQALNEIIVKANLTEPHKPIEIKK